MEMNCKELWKDKAGKVHSPSKTYLRKLVARCTREVRQQKNENEVSCARKAMIVMGLALNAHGVQEVGQLTSELQRIIAKRKAVLHAARSGV